MRIYALKTFKDNSCNLVERCAFKRLKNVRLTKIKLEGTHLTLRTYKQCRTAPEIEPGPFNYTSTTT